MKNIKLTVLFIVLLTTNAVFGQIAPPPAPPPPPPGLPVDGGVVFLLVSGLIYGVTKLKK
ncbi:PID-CTERM protein-sorting domain-containing protein [Polaribacter sp. IC073]|uniref:PID-CTERM protein-sorting domain-containing protein n=1 Tax=Polaribacter sp. IC073 TaxID=2508540 RepID=UPI0011BF26F7|nr:hypothetical protein [Polaribacter sp. IC073]TXD47742.1 hypothetical protein ES045_10670 [Polaribacter sp. IC073]